MAETCTYADVDFVVEAFPAVLVTTPEKWLVTIVPPVLAGDYTVTMLGAPFTYAAADGEPVADVQAGLLLALGGQMFAAVSPFGGAALLVQAPDATPLDLEAAGPGEGSLTATLIGGGASNTAAIDFWLEWAKCGLPPCCAVTCARDYTMMHAALAAHALEYYGGSGNSGQAAGDFERMRLGPAELTKGVSAWAANPADGDLAKTGPGQLYLLIRSRYVFPVAVQCGPPYGNGYGPGLGWGLWV